MLERTYKAREIGEASARIKRDLGEDAVILSARMVRSGQAGAQGAGYEIKAAPFGMLNGAQAERLGLGRAEAKSATLERRLMQSGVPSNLARTLAMTARRTLRERNVPLVEALTESLRAEVTFAPASRARVVALVGPTGVGKTTTLAKLAAVAALVERRQVALICLDHYRIGASEQLQRYADLIGVPMECAFDGPGLRKALGKLSRANLVFIDTSGRSPRDTIGIKLTAEALLGAGESVETHLCVAAATREAELVRIVEQHTSIMPTRMVVTKIDEALSCGGVLHAYSESGLPLSYLTTGQRVPEDIESACPEVLAALLYGEESQT